MTDDPSATFYEQAQDLPPMPVHIASSSAEPVRQVAPEYATPMTWTVDTFQNMGKPLQIFPRRYRRTKGLIYVQSLGLTGTVQNVQGNVTSPAAGAQIVSIAGASIAPGEYTIQWTVGLSGTLGAGDVDNFQLRQGANTIAASDNPDISGEWPQLPYGPVYLNGSQAITVRANAVGTTGAIYQATLALIPIAPNNATASILFNSRQELLMQPVSPQGLLISVPTLIQWENQKPCWCVLTPGSLGPIQISTLDQAYEET